MTLFEQLPRSGYLPDLIASEIMQQINEGKLQPGDILPTETALAESFGVSRNVVREAIARLRSDGILDTKQGRGASVKHPSERTTLRMTVPSAEDYDLLQKFFEMRAVLESEAAALAASRREPEQLERLSHTVDVFHGKVRYDEECLAAAGEFHRIIGEMANNEYLGMIIDYVSGRLKELSQATADSGDRSGVLVQATIDEHRAILNAIRNKDAETARKVMRVHVAASGLRFGVSLPDVPN